MDTTTRYVTDEQLLDAPRDGQKYERVDGELRVSPGGVRHSVVSVNVGARLGLFVEERKLGYVVGSRTGYRWPGRKADRPDNVRSPDVSFVAIGRFPDEPSTARTWCPDSSVH